MSGLTVIRVRHRCCFLFAYLIAFWTNAFISPVSRLFSLGLYLLRPGRTNALVGSKTAYFTCLWTASMSGLTVIRVRHRCCFLFALFACFYKCACGPEIAKSREMAWGRHSIQFLKHSAMPGGCLKKSFGNQLRKSMM